MLNDFGSQNEVIMKQPKIIIKKDNTDKAIEGIGLVALFILILLPLYFFNELPDEIPRHFDHRGDPTAFSSKNIIWLFPTIGALTYLSLALLTRIPHLYNYPKPITAENAKRQYKGATRLIRILNTVIVSIFAYIQYVIIQTALGETSGLGAWFLPVFLLMVFAPIGWFIFKSIRSS